MKHKFHFNLVMGLLSIMYFIFLLKTKNIKMKNKFQFVACDYSVNNGKTRKPVDKLKCLL